jgi:hypothetical protein
LPEWNAYADTEPNSDAVTYGYAQHNAVTDDNANSQPDYYAERYTETNSNTSTYPNTKTASYPAGLRLTMVLCHIVRITVERVVLNALARRNPAWPPDICAFGGYFPSSSEKPIHLPDVRGVSLSAT